MHAHENGAITKIYGGDNPYSKPVKMFNTNGEFIERFNSAAEASRKHNINQMAIGNCANLRSKTSGGYIWRFDTPDQ